MPNHGKHSAVLEEAPPLKARRRKRRRRRRLPIPVLILIDLLCIAIGLNLFALFHHVINFTPKTDGIALPTQQASTPVPTLTAVPESTAAPAASDAAPVETPEPTPEITPEPLPLTWAKKYAEHFTAGEVIQTDSSYRSANVAVEMTVVQNDGIKYHVAEIWLTDLKYLRSAFANGHYGYGTQQTSAIASKNSAIVAISGDHYTGRYEGVLIRNGVLYRETRFKDVAILTYDGELITMTDEELDLDSIKTQGGVYQLWSFGPQLLIDGKAQTEFNSDVTKANPRSAIGYVEPGHYFFVQVDGRTNDSRGMTMAELSQLFEDLGCVTAYNLDGGQTAGMYWNGALLSYPYGRPVGDIICITEVIPED